MSSAPGDAGIANERTALAWQRTALSLVTAAAILARLTWTRLGVGALVVLSLAIVLAGWVFFESRSRYRRTACADTHRTARGGKTSFLLAASAALLGAVELSALLV